MISNSSRDLAADLLKDIIYRSKTPESRFNDRSPLRSWVDEPPGEDPLALSVCAHRQFLAEPNSGRYRDLFAQRPTDSDRQRAGDIRRYYRDKIMFKKLRGQELTKYQHDLYELLNHDTVPQQRHTGMIYQLPFFYQEDCQRMTLEQRFADRSARTIPTSSLDLVLDFTLEDTIFVARSTKDSKEFWFTDEDGHVAVWTVSLNNPLMTLVESLISSQSSTRLRVKLKPGHRVASSINFNELFHVRIP